MGRLLIKIGKLLLENSQNVEQQENIFAIVNQLNIGRNLINSQVDKYELAQLNLIAGIKAKTSTAYDAAIKYLQVGLELLPIDSWRNEYELTLKLYIEATETEYLNINFTQAENYIEIVKTNAKQLIDTIKVEEIKIAIYVAQMQIKLGIDTGLNLINLLGFNLEKAPPPHLNVDELIHLPDMNGDDKIATMRILTNLTAASYFADASLFPQIIFTMIHLSNQYGNCAFSAHGYVNYGLILCGFFSDIDTGYRFGEIALSLLEKFDARTIKCRQKLLSDEEKYNNIHIHITTQIVDNWVQISIKDNGIGIQPEVKNRIFDPFFTTKPVGEGTGLGLSISYQIVVDKHNGRLDCISEVNKGTEFIIAIPLDIQ